MHSSHLNHHSNTHPSHQQQQQHNTGGSVAAVEDRVEKTMQQRMKPSPSTSSFQRTKSCKKDGATNRPSQRQSSIRARGRCDRDGSKAKGNVSDGATLDDFDIMLMHEDFPHLLMIAAKVKATHRKIAKALDPSTTVGGIADHANASPTISTKSSNTSYRPKNALLPDEVLRAVERMQQVLIQKKASDDGVIPRGRYPITDSLMEDAMIVLHEEYECGKQWLVQHDEAAKSLNCSSSSESSDALFGFNGKCNNNDLSMSSDNSSNTAAGGPITIKYAKWQTDALMNWMIENKDQPFPDIDAIELLVQQTGLTSSQIVNWTTNVRKRNRKATCENGKKPHHFLDFLFLVHDRETKRANTAAAKDYIGGLDVNVSDYTNECRIKYGESPRMEPMVSQLGKPNVHTTSPAKGSGAFAFPQSESVLLPPHSHHEHYVQFKSALPNRFVTESTIDYTVRDEGIDTNEPIPLLSPSNDEIMFDFANSWLNENRMMDTETFHDYRVPPHTMKDNIPMMDGQILPSVTDDSHDNHVSGRYDAPYLSLENLIDDDDMFIEEWTAFGQI